MSIFQNTQGKGIGGGLFANDDFLEKRNTYYTQANDFQQGTDLSRKMGQRMLDSLYASMQPKKAVVQQPVRKPVKQVPVVSSGTGAVDTSTPVAAVQQPVAVPVTSQYVPGLNIDPLAGAAGQQQDVMQYIASLIGNGSASGLLQTLLPGMNF